MQIKRNLQTLDLLWFTELLRYSTMHIWKASLIILTVIQVLQAFYSLYIFLKSKNLNLAENYKINTITKKKTIY